MLTKYRLSPDLSVAVATVPPVTTKALASPSTTNHVLIVDCSGSMYYDLPRLRGHLKNKVSRVMRETDTLSIIWFSGKGEFGVVFEGVTVPSLRELSSVHAQIDRWLKPVGLTGFLEPITELNNLVARVGKNGAPVSVFFMSDGCDNQWPRDKILSAIDNVKGVASAVIVEYGFYADRPFLAKMAAKWGAAHIFSDNFEAYEPILEAAVTKHAPVGERLQVEVDADFVVTAQNGEVIIHEVANKKVSLPVGTVEYAYLDKSGEDSHADIKALNHETFLYALVAAAAPMMRSDIIKPVLRRLGDIAIAHQYANCFGKQAYSKFQEFVTKATFDRNQRFIAGYSNNVVPRDDAFTILDLLQLLSDSPTARVDADGPDFGYSRIGRKRVDANTRLDAAEREELDQLQSSLSNVRDVALLKVIQERIHTLVNKPEPLKFEADQKSQLERGYPVDGLVMNEDRPNISFRVKRNGFVDLSSRLKDAPAPDKIPSKFPTFTFRNYTVVRDGIVNIDKLPVVNLHFTDTDRINAAISEGRLDKSAIEKDAFGTTTFDLTKIPIINAKMANRASAEEMFRVHWSMLKNQAELKVYKNEHSSLYDKKSEGFAALYGDEMAKWLADQGLVSYSGFNPRVLQADSTDFYMAKVLEVKLKGYSSLPSVDKVHEQIAKGKLNGPGELMKVAIDDLDKSKALNKGDAYKAWLEQKISDRTRLVRAAQFSLARIKFGVIVGQSWFSEFKSLDDKTMELDIDGKKLLFTADLKEVEEKI